MRKLLFLFIVVAFVGCTDCFPQIIPDIHVQVTADCEFTIPDYRGLFDYIDNCAIKDTVQLPAPGTVVSIITTPTVAIEIIARDVSNNVTTATFNLILIDTIPPVIVPKAIAIGQMEEFPVRASVNDRRAIPIIFRGSPPRGTGILRELAVYHNGFDNDNMELALYSDKDGKPFKLMATTGEFKTHPTQGWQVEPVLEEIRLVDGQPLWIAFVKDGEGGFNYKEIGVPNRVSAANGDYSVGMPLEFGTCTQSTYTYAAHLRYTADGGEMPDVMIAEMYLNVEQFVNKEIDGYVEEFDWSTAGMDVVFGYPKCVPIPNAGE